MVAAAIMDKVEIRPGPGGSKRKGAGATHDYNGVGVYPHIERNCLRKTAQCVSEKGSRRRKEAEGFAGDMRIVGTESVCDTEDSRQPDVVNHWETPDRVKTISLAHMKNSLVLPALSATAVECVAE
jgi:hypothetical protein